MTYYRGVSRTLIVQCVTVLLCYLIVQCVTVLVCYLIVQCVTVLVCYLIMQYVTGLVCVSKTVLSGVLMSSDVYHDVASIQNIGYVIDND